MKISLNTFLWLLWRDIRALRKTFINQWINYSFLLCTTIVVNNYFMPLLGIRADFGILMFVSQIAAGIAWAATGDTGAFAYDLQGQKSVLYELTLPITYRLVYLKYACAYAIKAYLINLATMPVGALFVIKKINWNTISPFKFIIVYPISAMFFAIFGLFVVVFCKNAEGVNQFWFRWGMLIWMFSGLFTPWRIMYQAAALAGYVTLLNPFLYVYEAAHTAFMGQADFINFWLCGLAIIGFSTFFACCGMYLFKKRLDCV